MFCITSSSTELLSKSDILLFCHMKTATGEQCNYKMHLVDKSPLLLGTWEYILW